MVVTIIYVIALFCEAKKIKEDDPQRDVKRKLHRIELWISIGLIGYFCEKVVIALVV